MSLTKDEVQHIAKLARIGLTEAEVEKFQKDLASIFGLIEELNEAKVEGMAVFEGQEMNRTREDMQTSKDDPQDIVKNFPNSQDRFNKVRSVF